MKALVIAAALLLPLSAQAAESAWPMVGRDLTNNRNASDEKIISAANAAQLKQLWATPVKGVQQETPVSDGAMLYVANAQGTIFAIEKKTGKIAREMDIAAALNLPGVGARGLAVTDKAVIFGLRGNPTLAAIDKKTGALLWKTKIDQHPLAGITQPPLVYQGRVYVGVSGVGEEVQATYGSYKACCTFRGSVVALDAATGKQLWKTFVIPEGFAGASIWSRMPAFDPKRRTLYVTSGNLYRAPPAVQDCVSKNRSDKTAVLACYPSNVWNDSIIALNPDTGAIKWAFRADNVDIFTGACLVPEQGGFCGGGDDVDFGNGAMLWKVKGRAYVGAGQKSGVFWALDADTGHPVWESTLGPAGPTGGILKGSATDGARVYAAEGNTKQVRHFPQSYTLPGGQTIKYGSFAAMDAVTGKILWQVPDPAGVKSPGNATPCEVNSPREDCTGAFPKGPVTVANGVVFACSTAPDGPMYAFDAKNGAMLWSFNSGSACDSGAAIMDGVVYWVGGRSLYAFAPPHAATPAKKK